MRPAMNASSQTACRGQLLRHASMASGYERGLLEIHASNSSVSGSTPANLSDLIGVTLCVNPRSRSRDYIYVRAWASVARPTTSATAGLQVAREERRSCHRHKMFHPRIFRDAALCNDDELSRAASRRAQAVRFRASDRGHAVHRTSLERHLESADHRGSP